MPSCWSRNALPLTLLKNLCYVPLVCLTTVLHISHCDTKNILFTPQLFLCHTKDHCYLRLGKSLLHVSNQKQTLKVITLSVFHFPTNSLSKLKVNHAKICNREANIYKRSWWLVIKTGRYSKSIEGLFLTCNPVRSNGSKESILQFDDCK